MVNMVHSSVLSCLRSTPNIRIAMPDAGEHDLRQGQGPVHQCAIPASLVVAASAAVWCCTIAPTVASKKLVKLDG